jgi:galactokinase
MSSLNQIIIHRVKEEFHSHFNTAPEVLLLSPGRINLIGEHTDYNKGFVLPSAVSLGIYFAIGKSSDDVHHWHALDLNKSLDLRGDAIGPQRHDWSDFLHGSWLALKETHPDLPHFRATFSADLPMGSGMSSSSALTCGVLFGLNEAFELNLNRMEIASLAHRVEREFIGLRGGIMDQYASVLSKPNQFLLLDCDNLSHTSIAASGDVHLFLIHTNVHRELTTSGYNDRADECALAVKQISQHKSIDSLRDISLRELQNIQSSIDPIQFKRAEYVIKENQRVHAAVEAIRHAHWDALGKLLYEGHEGLRKEYEVSIPELDFLVDFTKKEDWIYGARMMGGGFGGCTINISKNYPPQEFIDRLTTAYQAQFSIPPTFISVSLTGGTRLI